jgi:glyoxylase-like metal-dependent hydrolase (beta-lactamase superfamily II)
LTAVDIAGDRGYEELARYLLSKGGEPTPVADPEITELTGTIHKITFCYQQCTNMLVLDGSDGVLVIDTGYRRTAEELKTAIHTIAKGRKITVINTHQHPDHIGGNSIAGDHDSIISGENLVQMALRGIIEKSNGVLQGLSGRKYEGNAARWRAEQIRFLQHIHTHAQHGILD